ncbi:unnamed protein product [Ambrosiozyma monospora]|uniref:Unnamed protein product n=1 Tax=Ambrosiozyma monospora TaxID=43982 RepID=A0ACB5SVT7_AMBMO|nr:unnamed protein product [Ambrosiozyma monospora]
MRLNDTTNDHGAENAAWLANVSRNPDFFNVPLDIPNYVKRFHSVDDLIEHISPLEGIQNPHTGITTTYRSVNSINEKIFDKLDSPPMVYRAENSIFKDHVQFHHYTQEVLNIIIVPV